MEYYVYIILDSKRLIGGQPHLSLVWEEWNMEGSRIQLCKYYQEKEERFFLKDTHQYIQFKILVTISNTYSQLFLLLVCRHFLDLTLLFQKNSYIAKMKRTFKNQIVPNIFFCLTLATTKNNIAIQEQLIKIDHKYYWLAQFVNNLSNSQDFICY